MKLFDKEEKPTKAAKEAIKRGVDKAKTENRPLGILFVCLGNICRSPAAEGVMSAVAARSPGLMSLDLDSAGFYGGHAGELPDSRMRQAAKRRGLELTHRSRTVRASDFDIFDIIIGMDDNNISSLRRVAPTLEDDAKIVRMSDLTPSFATMDSVPDPYWEGADGFELVLDMLEDGCNTLAQIIEACE